MQQSADRDSADHARMVYGDSRAATEDLCTLLDRGQNLISLGKLLRLLKVGFVVQLDLINCCVKILIINIQWWNLIYRYSIQCITHLVHTECLAAQVVPKYTTAGWRKRFNTLLD